MSSNFCLVSSCQVFFFSFCIVLFTFFSKTTDVWYQWKVYVGYLLLCINRYISIFFLLFFYAATVNPTYLWFSDSSFELVWTNIEYVINPEVILCDWRDVKNPKLTTPTPPHPLPLPLPTRNNFPTPPPPPPCYSLRLRAPRIVSGSRPIRLACYCTRKMEPFGNDLAGNRSRRMLQWRNEDKPVAAPWSVPRRTTAVIFPLSVV